MQQVLQRRWDPTFSEHSYGFRPGRSAHHAIAQAQRYIADGAGYVVDLDLEKFFDRVNHDRLMGHVARRVADTRLLTLIRAFLNAGVMENGLVGPRMDEGVPQGGPLSPVLSNLVLDELDRELERRGHRFVRYADDCIHLTGVARRRCSPRAIRWRTRQARRVPTRPRRRWRDSSRSMAGDEAPGSALGHGRRRVQHPKEPRAGARVIHRPSSHP